MAEATAGRAEPRSRSRRLALIFGIVLAFAGAAVGYLAVRSGMLPFKDRAQVSPVDKATRTKMQEISPAGTRVEDIEFIEIDPLLISLVRGQGTKHLRFRAQLEVATAHAKDVVRLMPRIVDVLNGYLRALEVSDLDDALALTRLRAQMLRRVQIVVGEGRVNDLLIMEFVLN